MVKRTIGFNWGAAGLSENHMMDIHLHKTP